MRRLMALLFAGLLIAGPARSQEPCPFDMRIPVNLRVASPICPNQPLVLIAEACGPCVDLTGWEWNPGIPLQIHAVMDTRECILTLCQLDSLNIPIGSFAPGQYRLVVEVAGTVVGEDGAVCTLVQQEEVSFEVQQSCAPLPGPLPYTDIIRVGNPPPCDNCPPPPICPQREIPFFIAGSFPSDCLGLLGLELLPSLSASPLPQPPIARVTVGVNDCLGMPCTEVPVPWQAGALMPGLPPGDYQMLVQLQEVSLCNPSSVLALHDTLVSFTVAEDCAIPPAPSCFLYAWHTNPDDPNCDTRVGPGTPGRLLFDVSGFSLAGLQGRFALDPHGLRVSDLRLVGVGAIGMRLLWRELADGASFVAYRESGAICGAIDCPWGIEATVSARSDVPIPARSTLAAVELLGTDALGREVPLCPTFAPIQPARICAGPKRCDFNGDLRVDVRDLVLMVHCLRDPGACCLRDPGACSNSSPSVFDCNGDGDFDLDDILCCARVILQGSMPDSVAKRPAPELTVALGSPVSAIGGVDLPVRVTRADLVGAARLAFSYPADRFAGARVELLGDASRWLEISEAAGGEMVVGLIATSPDVSAESDLDLILHFELASGQEPSTAVHLVASEFAGPDGVPLAPGSSTTSVPPKGTVLELSAARPNPFGNETRFVLGISRATEADLAVFDLSGRRLVTLHHGRLEAGEYTFRWDGTTSDGARVSDGVYFYRAVAAGASATRKLVLLRGR